MTIRRPARVTPRAARIGLAGSAAAALLVAAGLVWQSAYAGFGDATTPRTLPTVSTGTVVLADDDANGTMFTVSGLRPGDTGTKCISVTASGSAPADVRLYVTGRSTTNGLSSYLNLTVTAGTGGTFANCTGFTPLTTGSVVYNNGSLAAFPNDAWSSGIGSWLTAGKTTGEKRTYKFVYTLAAGAPLSAQGGSATTTFVWEAQPT